MPGPSRCQTCGHVYAQHDLWTVCLVPSCRCVLFREPPRPKQKPDAQPKRRRGVR